MCRRLRACQCRVPYATATTRASSRIRPIASNAVASTSRSEVKSSLLSRNTVNESPTPGAATAKAHSVSSGDGENSPNCVLAPKSALDLPNPGDDVATVPVPGFPAVVSRTWSSAP